MARNPDFIRTIINRPSDDTARLVYADWLDENGDPLHAELLRVQCELAHFKTCVGGRRQKLVDRQEELLSGPGFHLPGHRPFVYSHGFVVENCNLNLTNKGAELDTLDLDADDELEPIIYLLQPSDLLVLDRVRNLKLNLSRLPTTRAEWDAPFTVDCLRRVTVLDGYYGPVDLAALEQLQQCRHLGGVTTISFKGAPVTFRVVENLFLSAALPNVTRLHLDVNEWLVDNHAAATEDDVAAFVARLGDSPKAAQLVHLELSFSIGPEVVQALIDAPHLRCLEQLWLVTNRRRKKSMRDALRKRFGKALKM